MRIAFRIRLKDVVEWLEAHSSGAFSKSVSVVLSDKSLLVENVFDCDVSVPHTDLAIKRTTLYAPGERI